MEPTQWAAVFDAATPALKGIGAIIVCVLGGKGLWDFLAKWLETRDDKDEREMAQDEARAIRDQKQIADLLAAHEPLIAKAALLEPCREENVRLAGEVAEWKRKHDAVAHENAQLQTAKMGWDFFQSNPSILRKLADDLERKANENTQH